jgi:hypothetical protein
MSDVFAERQCLGNTCQHFHGIPKQPFGQSARVSGTHAWVVPTVDEAMCFMSFPIIKQAPCIGVVAGLRRLTSKDHR